MKTDRELLELAAKAAALGPLVFANGSDDDGYDDGVWKYTWRCGESKQLVDWNPLDDDGDALRLAVKIGISPDWGGFDIEVCRTSSGARNFCYVEPHGADPYAATRRAIVRAAAEIGTSL